LNAPGAGPDGEVREDARYVGLAPWRRRRGGGAAAARGLEDQADVELGHLMR
jgi:hypothetical protein